MASGIRLEGPRSLRPGAVLVVDPNEDQRDLVSLMLRAAGYAVIPCSGPRAREHECLGTLTRDCPVAAIADVVVLRAPAASDPVRAVVASEELASYYESAGLPVVRPDRSRKMLIRAVEDALTQVQAGRQRAVSR